MPTHSLLNKGTVTSPWLVTGGGGDGVERTLIEDTLLLSSNRVSGDTASYPSGRGEGVLTGVTSEHDEEHHFLVRRVRII